MNGVNQICPLDADILSPIEYQKNMANRARRYQARIERNDAGYFRFAGAGDVKKHRVTFADTGAILFWSVRLE
jgi:hypothetical protein